MIRARAAAQRRENDQATAMPRRGESPHCCRLRAVRQGWKNIRDGLTRADRACSEGYAAMRSLQHQLRVLNTELAGKLSHSRQDLRGLHDLRPLLRRAFALRREYWWSAPR